MTYAQKITFRQNKDGYKREDIEVTTPASSSLSEEILSKIVEAWGYDFAKAYLDDNPEATAIPDDAWNEKALAEFFTSGRKSSTPSDEELEAFREAYVTYMPLDPNMDEEKAKKAIENASIVFANKLTKFLRAPDHLAKLSQRLDTFQTVAPEGFSSTCAWFRKRINKALEAIQNESELY